MTVNLQQKHAEQQRSYQLRDIAQLMRRYRVTIDELTEYLNGYKTTSESLYGIRQQAATEQRRIANLATRRATLAQARATRQAAKGETDE